MDRDFDLRPLGALDLDAAAKLHAEAFVPMGERGWTRQDIAELLASPGVGGLLVEAEGAQIGMALWRLAADEGELLTIAVDRQGRRAGAGRRLLACVIEQAKNSGAGALFLEVGVANFAARRLYDTLGFEVVGRRTAYYSRGVLPSVDALVMRLTLK